MKKVFFKPPDEFPDREKLDGWMREALALAEESAAEDEIPVGAVVVDLEHDRVIGRGRDRKMTLADPTAHAEMLAMREAAAAQGDWRLENCILVVTLEPCPMCAGAILMARIPQVVFGAYNPKFGAMGSLGDVTALGKWNHRVKSLGGVLESDCAAVMQEYFRKQRRR